MVWVGDVWKGKVVERVRQLLFNTGINYLQLEIGKKIDANNQEWSG